MSIAPRHAGGIAIDAAANSHRPRIRSGAGIPNWPRHLGEGVHPAREIKPSVLAGRKDGLFRPRKRRIAEGPDSDPNHLRHAFRLPKHCRSAMWTEVKGHSRSRNRVSCERLRSTSNDVHRSSGVKSRDPRVRSRFAAGNRCNDTSKHASVRHRNGAVAARRRKEQNVESSEPPGLGRESRVMSCSPLARRALGLPPARRSADKRRSVPG